jgi:hypothetical protein
LRQFEDCRVIAQHNNARNERIQALLGFRTWPESPEALSNTLFLFVEVFDIRRARPIVWLRYAQRALPNKRPNCEQIP